MIEKARSKDRGRMEGDGNRSLHARVRGGYGILPPAERRLADLVLNFPGELAGYSTSELARMAETSNAAVSRFVRRLGFSNYEEMRRLARAEREAGAPSYMLRHDTFAHGGVDVLERHVETAIANARKTFGTIDRAMLATLVARLAAATCVWIIGFRHGFFMASYLRWSLAHVRPNVRLLPAAGETLGETLVEFDEGDVAILFAMRRRVAAVARIIQMAKTANAAVAVVTDPGMVDTGEADWVFRCETRTKGPFDDHTSALIFAHVVTEQVMAVLSDTARPRLGRIDDFHVRLGELST